MALKRLVNICTRFVESQSFCYSLKIGGRSSAAHTHCQWYTFPLIIFLVWNSTWIYSNSWFCQIFFCCSKSCIKDMHSSVTQSCLTLCNPMDCNTPGFPVHHQLPELAQTHVHRVSDATQPSSVVPFFFCFQSFPASGSSPLNQFFASGDQSIGASATVFPVNIQDWFPLRLTGLISLQFKGLSWVLSNTTVQKHRFISTQFSLWSNSHIHTWRLGKP